MKTRIFKYLSGFVIIILLIAGCENSLPNLSINPYDPVSAGFKGNPAVNLNVETLDFNKIMLSWKDSSNFENGFFIQKQNLSDNTDSGITAPKNVNLIYDNVNFFKEYKYKLANITHTPLYIFTDSITIKYKPYTLVNLSGNYYQIQTSGDEKRIVDGNLIYDFKDSLKLAGHINFSHNYLNLSYDGKYLAFIDNGSIGYYNIDNSQKIILQYPAGTPDSIKTGYSNVYMSRDDNFLIGNNNYHIIIWNLSTLNYKVIGCESAIYYAIISPDDRFIIAASKYHLYIWETDNLQVYDGLIDNPLDQWITGLNKLCFTNDGKYLAFFNDIFPHNPPGTIYLLDLESKSYISTRVVNNYIYSMKFLDNDNFFEENYGDHTILRKLINYLPVDSIEAKGYPNLIFSNKWVKIK